MTRPVPGARRGRPRAARPLSVRLTVAMTPAEYEACRVAAAGRGMRLSAWARAELTDLAADVACPTCGSADVCSHLRRPG